MRGKKIDQVELLTLLLEPGQVVHVDDYGNIKIWGEVPPNGVKSISVGLGNGDLVQVPLVRTFEDVNVGGILAYRGSSDLLEIAVREDTNGGAAGLLGVNIGDQLNIRFEYRKV